MPEEEEVVVTLSRKARRVCLFNKAIVVSTEKEGLPIAYVARFDHRKFFRNMERWDFRKFPQAENVGIIVPRNIALPFPEMYKVSMYYDYYDHRYGSRFQSNKQSWLNEFASWCALEELYGDVVFFQEVGSDINLTRLWNVLKTAASEWSVNQQDNKSHVTFKELDLLDPKFYDLTGIPEWSEKNKGYHGTDDEESEASDTDVDVDVDSAVLIQKTVRRFVCQRRYKRSKME